MFLSALCISLRIRVGEFLAVGSTSSGQLPGFLASRDVDCPPWARAWCGDAGEPLRVHADTTTAEVCVTILIFDFGTYHDRGTLSEVVLILARHRLWARVMRRNYHQICKTN